jgi:hypothetical protein
VPTFDLPPVCYPIAVREILSKKMLRLVLSAGVSCPRELCGRMISNHPVQTRDFFGFREPSRSDVEEVSEGLGNEALLKSRTSNTS